MNDFARLETHEGLQVLSRIEAKQGSNGEYGPHLITRCDPSVTVEIHEGPWSDDDDGWDAAEKALAQKDLASFARSSVAACKRLLK
ncbi:hypothetical protein [Oceaniglobus trochenteri]|uniref:hypothetical protein n=1 Tax=Oceaniglobus trochenteri TaxID=2763260 RepID=UPI001CFFB239|nr:hypothetical protein [Oceaniglobus trochenteri]